MRTVIFGSGDIKDYNRVKDYIRPDDYIICADGGYDHTAAAGIRADMLIGDFDSIKKLPDNIKTVRYPQKKDLTDSELALKEAEALGSEEILLFGFTGDRADHTAANMLLLTRYGNAVIIDDNNEIRLLDGSLEIFGKVGQTVSIVPVCGDLKGVTTEGLEYSLNNETLYIGESRGVSNVMTAERAVIKCSCGKALVIKPSRV